MMKHGQLAKKLKISMPSKVFALMMEDAEESMPVSPIWKSMRGRL